MLIPSHLWLLGSCEPGFLLYHTVPCHIMAWSSHISLNNQVPPEAWVGWVGFPERGDGVSGRSRAHDHHEHFDPPAGPPYLPLPHPRSPVFPVCLWKPILTQNSVSRSECSLNLDISLNTTPVCLFPSWHLFSVRIHCLSFLEEERDIISSFTLTEFVPSQDHLHI